jgi:site-specific recombinase XerD
LALLGKLPRAESSPYVFVWEFSQTQVRDPRYWFFRGRQKAGLAWVGFHDLRHFRATQWIMRGVDIRSVQGLLGHSNMKTTDRYVKFVPGHAAQRVIEAQRQEDIEWSHRRQIGDKTEKNSVGLVSC